MKKLLFSGLLCLICLRLLAQPPQVIVQNLPAGVTDGVNYLSDTRVIVSLFAPRKENVYLLGEFNNFQQTPQSLMRRTPDGSRFWLEVNGLVAGQEYAYQFLVDGTLTAADPYADKILDPDNDRNIPASVFPSLKTVPAAARGIVSVLQTGQRPFVFRSAKPAQLPDDRLMIYRVLLRDFIANPSYKALSDSVAYFKKLGVNAIQLMPVLEFGGNGSEAVNYWGNNPNFFFAPDKVYGPKDELKAFVDKCHANGIFVFLEMPLDQVDKDFTYVKLYPNGGRLSNDNPFLNVRSSQAFSVLFDINHESAFTRAFIDRLLEYWLKEYNIDGFRLFNAAGYTQTFTANDPSQVGNVDASRQANLLRILNKVKSIDRRAVVISDEFFDPRETIPMAQNGMMLVLNMHSQFNFLMRGLESELDFNQMSFKRYDLPSGQLTAFMEDIEEQSQLGSMLRLGNGNATHNPRNLPDALERAKLAAAFFILYPGSKTFWQFQEMGNEYFFEDEKTIKAPRPPQWDNLKNAGKVKLLKAYQELLKLKNANRIFTDINYSEAKGEKMKRMTFNSPEGQAHLIGNFGTEPALIRTAFPRTGKWFDFFTGDEITVTETTAEVLLQAAEFHVYLDQKPSFTPEKGIVPWQGKLGLITANSPEFERGIILAPNPSRDFVTLKLPEGTTGDVTFQITDLSGRSVFVEKINSLGAESHSIDVRSLANGTYLLGIQSDKSSAVKKIIKY